MNNQYLVETMQHLAENNSFRLKLGFDRRRVLPPGLSRHIRSLILDWHTFIDATMTNIRGTIPQLGRLESNIHCNDASDILLFNIEECPHKTMVRRMPLLVALSNVHGLQEFEVHYVACYGPGCSARSLEGRDERKLRLDSFGRCFTR